MRVSEALVVNIVEIDKPLVVHVLIDDSSIALFNWSPVGFGIIAGPLDSLVAKVSIIRQVITDLDRNRLSEDSFSNTLRL